MNMTTNDICIIYTDGGAHNERGNMHTIGSSAWLCSTSDEIIQVYGKRYNNVTNNKTEMLAAINAIKQFGNKHKLLMIISDSGYLVKGYNDPSYLETWMSNGWKTSAKTPVKNKDLWEKLISLSWHNRFVLRHIAGHGKDPNVIHAYFNDIVDKCCTYLMQSDIENDILWKMYYDTELRKIINIEKVEK